MPLLRNFSWMMLAEVFSRLSRLVTLFVLAANFTNQDYGLAMLALLIHELFRVFTRLGTGAKIIQCSDSVLLPTLQNAATLQWAVALFISAMQIACAKWIALFYQMPALADLLTIMALAHLFYPIVAVRIFEQHRQNRLRFYGIASGCCIAFENLLIAGIVLFEATVFAVAWAKVAAALFWVILFFRLPSQLKQYRFEWDLQLELMRFSFATLGSELSRMLRFQSDSLIAARLLPPEQFGLYSFAKSAGLGIAQSFSQAYTSSLYPYLCKLFRQSDNRRLALRTTWKVTITVCALFLIQALAAPIYIEWLFDSRWENGTTIAALLCLIAIPTLLIDHHTLMFRAQNQAGKEMKVTMLCTLITITALLLVQPESVSMTAFTVLTCSLFWCGFLVGRRTSDSDKAMPAHLRSQAI